jgi:hypothetical protein
VLEASPAMDSLPWAERAPVQPPDAVHAVAPVEVQASVVAPPCAMVSGVALSVTVGVAAGRTDTEALAAALPPAPVQVRVKVLADESAAEDSEPAVPRLPLQPPEAVQAVALVELQVSVADPPAARAVGLAFRVTEGAASPRGGTGASVPPPPQAAAAAASNHAVLSSARRCQGFMRLGLSADLVGPGHMTASQQCDDRARTPAGVRAEV